MKYTHYEDGGKIERGAFAQGGTWRTYFRADGVWYPVPGSMNGTLKGSWDYARRRYPVATLKTVYHSDGEERD